MRKTLGMNKHQKAAHRVKEQRVGSEQIAELLDMSRSEDPEERLEAATYLCPCHVRRRIDSVWDALYRLLEDEDVRVRRAAWHTLEDGGRPDDPTLDGILDRVLSADPDSQVQGFARKVAGPRKDRELVRARLAGRPAARRRGRCDFCGASDVPVEQDLETMIPTGDLPRAALICDRCAGGSG
jgi:HEAT repeat protein